VRYCKKLDKFIETPEIKPIIDKYFVMARLDVQESEDKHSLNNPGGEEVKGQVGGKGMALPFFAFLNEKGETIVNSIRPGDAQAKEDNIGYPGQPFRVDWFLIMLKKAAPGMSPDETHVLENWLRAQEK